jgi:DNA-binding CsgD family transcriptional regulator
LPTGDVLTISLEREFNRGPAQAIELRRLDAVRPHIARSALMSARLRLERARTVSATLAAIGLAAAVLDAGGKVLAVNPLIERLGGYVRWRAMDRIALTDRKAEALFKGALESIHLESNRDVRSFPVRDAAAETLMVAHLIPVRLSARDIFAFSAAVLVLTPVTLPSAPPVELVQSLFDLTPSEARVARGLAGGKTVNDLAVDGGVSTNTVRTQVRGVLEKTGCERQADVVALLTAISSARPTSGGRPHQG